MQVFVSLSLFFMCLWICLFLCVQILVSLSVFFTQVFVSLSCKCFQVCLCFWLHLCALSNYYWWTIWTCSLIGLEHGGNIWSCSCSGKKPHFGRDCACKCRAKVVSSHLIIMITVMMMMMMMIDDDDDDDDNIIIIIRSCFLLQCLSITIQRFNSVAFCGTLPEPDLRVSQL